MRTVKLPLGPRTYSIVIGRRVADRLGRACARIGLASRCALVTDAKVGPAHAGVLASSTEAGFDPMMVTVPSGETAVPRPGRGVLSRLLSPPPRAIVRGCVGWQGGGDLAVSPP
jgi:3-dehydroquinate synthetase